MTKFFAFIVEAIAWVQIFIFPLIVGLVLGAIVYSYKQDIFGLILGGVITFGGVIAGILLANHIRKKRGTVNFLSKIIATPELDQKNEVTDDKDHEHK